MVVSEEDVFWGSTCNCYHGGDRALSRMYSTCVTTLKASFPQHALFEKFSGNNDKTTLLVRKAQQQSNIDIIECMVLWRALWAWLLVWHWSTKSLTPRSSSPVPTTSHLKQSALVLQIPRSTKPGKSGQPMC